MKTKSRTGARALVEALERVGAELVFGYPGGNVVDIFDELSRAPFKFVLGRHEQGCVHMADGYARALGRPGVVLVTSGPGLTNTITGLGAANMDGVPCRMLKCLSDVHGKGAMTGQYKDNLAKALLSLGKALSSWCAV